MANVSLMNAIIFPDINCAEQRALRIFTTIADSRFMVDSFIIECTGISNPSLSPIISMGTNQTFDNFLSQTSLSSLNKKNLTTKIQPNSLIVSIDPLTNFIFNIFSPAVADIFLIQLSIIGYYY